MGKKIINGIEVNTNLKRKRFDPRTSCQSNIIASNPDLYWQFEALETDSSVLSADGLYTLEPSTANYGQLSNGIENTTSLRPNPNFISSPTLSNSYQTTLPQYSVSIPPVLTFEFFYTFEPAKLTLLKFGNLDDSVNNGFAVSVVNEFTLGTDDEVSNSKMGLSISLSIKKNGVMNTFNEYYEDFDIPTNEFRHVVLVLNDETNLLSLYLNKEIIISMALQPNTLVPNSKAALLEILKEPEIVYIQHIENMRPLREYENYWRVTDYVSEAIGPQSIGSPLTLTQYHWAATASDNIITVQRLDLDGDIKLELTAPDTVISVSLEFDQSGSVLLAYETLQSSFFYRYDNNVSQYVTTEIQGKTPLVASTYTIAPVPTDWSSRYIFYIDTDTNEIKYKKQSDRFGVDYILDVSPGIQPLELLSAGPNMYGGFTISYASNGSNGIDINSTTVFEEIYKRPIGRSYLFSSYNISAEIYDENELLAGDYPIDYVPLIHISKSFNETQKVMSYPEAGVDLFEHVALFVFSDLHVGNNTSSNIEDGIGNLSVDSPIISYPEAGVDLFEHKALFIFSEKDFSESNKTITYTEAGIDNLSIETFNLLSYTLEEPTTTVSYSEAGVDLFEINEVA